MLDDTVKGIKGKRKRNGSIFWSLFIMSLNSQKEKGSIVTI